MATASAKQSPEDLVSEATKLKEEGNSAYAEKSYKAAIRLYHKSLLFARAAASPTSANLMGLESSSSSCTPATIEAKKLVSVCHNNIAAVILSNPESSQADYERAAVHCKEVLKVDGKNSKALYRLGQLQFNTGDVDKAVESLNKALDAGASASAVAKVKQACLEEQKVRKERQKQEWKGIFDRHRKDPSDGVVIPPEILELFSQFPDRSD